MTDVKRDELDDKLDVALARYAAVEPRTGLEERMLANMRAERAQVPDHAWWRWGLAVALAATVIVALALTLKSGKQSRPVVAIHSSATTEASKEPAILVVSGAGGNQHPLHASNSAKKRTTNHIRRETVVAANPKLDRFPSPQPLSEQELALARYVSEFPQEATLIARTQAEFENEIRQKMKEVHSETDDYGSDQQER
jgi:hypothetical protein